MSPTRHLLARGTVLASALVIVLVSPAARADRSSGRQFIASATVNADHTATLPLREGRSGGRVVWYIVTDTSDGHLSEALGVNESQKLNNARGTDAVQRVTVGSTGLIEFPATVDFGPVRRVEGDPTTGFPPLVAEPGAIAEPGYSPLIELPNGTILNAPHVANDTGMADKVVALDTVARRVTYALTDGFSNGAAVQYVSTDASDAVAAALEGVTFAPLLGSAPFAGGDGTDSSRASLAAVTNGQTGVTNRQRQGLNSTLLGEGDPRNVLAWTPNQGRYSPLWDVHLTTFAPGVPPRLLTGFGDVEDLASKGMVTAPDGTPFAPSGFIVNCPIVHQN